MDASPASLHTLTSLSVTLQGPAAIPVKEATDIPTRAIIEPNPARRRTDRAGPPSPQDAHRDGGTQVQAPPGVVETYPGTTHTTHDTERISVLYPRWTAG